MGFMGKIKQWMGIGGVKVTLAASGPLSSTGGAVAGTVQLTSKSDQHVNDLVVKVYELYSTGRGKEKRTREIDMGKLSIAQHLDLKAGETKDLSFSLPYTVSKSINDKLKEKGGMIGALGKLGSMAEAERSEFYVKASASVKGTALSSSDKAAMKMV
jgi:hypothetical protein